MKNVFFDETSKFNLEQKKFLQKKFSLTKLGDESALSPKEKEFSLDSDKKTRRSLALVILVLATVVFFLSRAIRLQISNGDSNLAMSTQNRIRRYNLQPERGVIYDRNGTILVRNKPSFSIEMNVDLCSLGERRFDLCNVTVDNLSKFISLDKNRISKEVAAARNIIVLSSGLQKEDILKLEANLAAFPSVSIVTAPQRDYIFGDAFAHLIGYVGLGDTPYPTITGKTGIEEKYDNLIGGLPGSRVVQIDSFGGSFKVLSEEKPIPGRDVTLNIDLNLQKKAYELLAKAVKDKKAVAGVVVAQDPRTGGVLALVSYPAFNPTKISEGISFEELNKLNTDPAFPFFNRTISGTYPPGSVFKLVMASAALSEKVIGENYRIFDPGYIKVGSYTFKNWKAEGHGDVDMRRALQVSNDTYFYTVGGGHNEIAGLGITRIAKWADRFGYGVKTGIDLGGEVSGYVPDGKEKTWYLGDTYITSIGQGEFLATPLQVNNVTSYFANGGIFYKPQVVKGIYGRQDFGPQIIAQNLIDVRAYGVVRDGMKLAVTSGGTAYPLFDFSQKHPEIELAGKTGTSEYTDSKGEAKTHALLTVFGPFENPTIALTVFLEGGGSGADDAAPIARQLLDGWFGKF